LELHRKIKSLENQLTQLHANVEHQLNAKEDERQRLETIVKRLESEKVSLEKRISYKDDFISKQLRDKEDELERERKEAAILKWAIIIKTIHTIKHSHILVYVNFAFA